MKQIHCCIRPIH